MDYTYSFHSLSSYGPLNFKNLIILSAILGGYFSYKTHLKFFTCIAPNLLVNLSICLNDKYLLSLTKFLKLILNSLIKGFYWLNVCTNVLSISFLLCISLTDILIDVPSSNLNLCFLILLTLLNLSLLLSFITI